MEKIKNKVEYIDINKLVLLKNNPRKISKENMNKLKKSIKDNPDYFEARPLIISNRTGENVILAGNQRYKASKELGLLQVPCVILKDLTEEKEKEIIIRDNVELGDWDYNLLSDWNVNNLNDWGVELNNFKINDINNETETKINIRETIVIIIDENNKTQEEIYNDLIERGYICHMSTL